LAAQRTRIETAKLLATFVAGMAGAVVATALQVGDPNGLDVTAVVFLLLTALGVVIVILLDRTKDVDVEAVALDAQLSGWNQTRLLEELRRLSYAAMNSNEAVVRATRTAASLTAVSALLAGVFATVSLLLSPA
jgi:preprotein translocase subunit SecG